MANSGCCLCHVCRRSQSYLRVSDVKAAAGDVTVTMGDDDYVILNGDLSFYAPPATEAAASGVGAPAQRAPWLRVLDASERAVFVELDSALRHRFDVTTCSVHVTSPTTEIRCRRQVRLKQPNCF